MYFKGLLCDLTMNWLPNRYSWNTNMTAHFRAKKFQFVHWVVALSLIQSVTSIPNHMLLSINGLIENYTQAKHAGISVENEGLLSLQRPRQGQCSRGPWSSQRPPDTVQFTAPASCFLCSHFLLKPAHTMDGQPRHTPSGTDDSSWWIPERTWPPLQYGEQVTFSWALFCTHPLGLHPWTLHGPDTQSPFWRIHSLLGLSLSPTPF